MRRIVSTLIVLSMLAVPTILLAQEAGDACVRAQLDAERDLNGALWFALGCLFPIVGLVVAYVAKPSPSATALLGKSSDYVAVYTDCYKDKGRNIQVRKALIGLLCVPTFGIALFWL